MQQAAGTAAQALKRHMKIAIDARKWRDYGIGTYVRNLVRRLARIDADTTYYLLCDQTDAATLRDLAENFVPVIDGSGGYTVREQLSIPLHLRPRLETTPTKHRNRQNNLDGGCISKAPDPELFRNCSGLS